MTIKSISDRDRERDETARAQSPQEAVDRLAGLLPDEALEDAPTCRDVGASLTPRSRPEYE
jgi:hypothetical protein